MALDNTGYTPDNVEDRTDEAFNSFLDILQSIEKLRDSAIAIWSDTQYGVQRSKFLTSYDIDEFNKQISKAHILFGARKYTQAKDTLESALDEIETAIYDFDATYN